MGRYAYPPNRECVDCGEPFYNRDCIRCKKCRTGKQGIQKGGRMGWNVCPKCGGKKGYHAKQCMICFKKELAEKKGK